MSRWWRVLAPAVLVAAAIVAVHPLAEAAGKPYLASTVATAACIAIGVCGIDLGLGVGHQFMLGQSAFFGIGAYAYANFAQDAGLPVLLAAGAAVLLAAVSGAAVGWVFSKLDGLLFAVANEANWASVAPRIVHVRVSSGLKRFGSFFEGKFTMMWKTSAW